MKLIPTNLTDCFVIEPAIFKDERGVFFESFNKKILEKTLKTSLDFVQDNHSVSKKGVLRGLHFQTGSFAQAKLVRVVQGEVLDVVVDLRKDSPSYLKHFKTILTSECPRMVFIPKGMAHGFLALKDETVFLYKCDAFYNKDAESGILYDDPELHIDWAYPSDKIILSEKDKKLPQLRDLMI